MSEPSPTRSISRRQWIEIYVVVAVIAAMLICQLAGMQVVGLVLGLVNLVLLVHSATWLVPKLRERGSARA